MDVMTDHSNFAEKLATKIIDLGLTVPAIFLLEANKPLAFVGSQLLLVAQPTMDLFLPNQFTGNLASLLTEPAEIDQLLARLEASADQRHSSGEVQS
jgi:hypothetical protein